MERREAAEFLGVSVSTLDRLASQGRLTRGRARRKTRPVTVYDEAELQRLKTELAAAGKGAAAAPLPPLKPQDAVGFRLDPYYVSRLHAEGAARGMSAGEYARKLVIQGLEEDAIERVRAELVALRQSLSHQNPSVPVTEAGLAGQFGKELAALRETLAEMFYLVLITKLGAGEGEATEIVANLTRPV